MKNFKDFFYSFYPVNLRLSASKITFKKVWLIVGLGNPGREYSNIRHNSGFRAITYIARKNHIALKKSPRYKGLIGKGKIGKEKIVLLQPLTYVNNSGIAVKLLLKRYKIKKNELLVLCDDLNLPLGKIRLRLKGSAGGHNGLKSIIACLGTGDFPRLRIGIGSPGEENLSDYVLSSFEKEENKEFKKVLEKIATAVEFLLEAGMEETMSKFN